MTAKLHMTPGHSPADLIYTYNKAVVREISQMLIHYHSSQLNLLREEEAVVKLFSRQLTTSIFPHRDLPYQLLL